MSAIQQCMPHAQLKKEKQPESLETRIAECASPSVHFLLERKHVRICWQFGFEIFKLLSYFRLHFQSNLNCTVQEAGDFNHVICLASARGHGWCANPNATW